MGLNQEKHVEIYSRGSYTLFFKRIFYNNFKAQIFEIDDRGVAKG